MVEVPRDVWFHIAQWIPDDDIRDHLLGLNPVFFELSMRLRYETVSITEVDQRTTWILNRLRDPAISCRVHKLVLRPQYRVRSPPTPNQSSSSSTRVGKLQRFAGSVSDYAHRYLPLSRSSPEPVVKVTHKQKMDQLLALAVEVIPNLTRLKDFSLDAWNIPPEVDLLAPTTAIWNAAGEQLQSVALTGYPRVIKDVTTAARLPSLERLSLDLTHDLYHSEQSTTSADDILPFVNRLASQIQDLNIALWTNIDLGSFFEGLSSFPQLERVVIDLEARRVEATTSIAAEHPHALKDLITLQVDPTGCPEGLDTTKRLIARSSESLRHLVIRNSYLAYEEISDVLNSIAEVTQIETLQICIHVLSVRFLKLAYQKCPNLKHLRLYIGRLGVDMPNVDGQDLFRQEIQQQSWPNWPVEELDIWQGGVTLDIELMYLMAAAMPRILQCQERHGLPPAAHPSCAINSRFTFTRPKRSATSVSPEAESMELDLSSPSTPSSTKSFVDPFEGFDKSSIADLVAKYGSSSASAWLEFDRYKIWRPSEPVPESSFLPVQGYMRRDPYIFAWGNPLVSDSAALKPTAAAFVAWANAQGLRPIWACVDHDLEQVLGGAPFEWSTVNCIHEDIVDPAHIVDVIREELNGKHDEGAGVPSHIKDLRKNIRRASRANVQIKEVHHEEWSAQERAEIDKGLEEWRKNRHGLQLAATSLKPWLDEEHRRYWIGRQEGHVVGILILTPIKGNNYQIKNCVSFPTAPKGTSEALIAAALKDLNDEQLARGSSGNHDRITVTFGITAADQLKPIENLSGWKVSALSKTYGQIAKTAGLLRRGDFRSKFDSEHDPMYVCYPEHGFGLHGVEALLKLLKK
ncbi:hypothetical protein ONZ45_g16590 [Pleurotus djamor]|nr:hypothetical protein ONZ45_g16590 [Pleurotus djamor]